MKRCHHRHRHHHRHQRACVQIVFHVCVCVRACDQCVLYVYLIDVIYVSCSCCVILCYCRTTTTTTTFTIMRCVVKFSRCCCYVAGVVIIWLFQTGGNKGRHHKFKNKHSHAYLMCETLVNSQSQVRARPIHFSLFIASTVQH